MKLKIEKPDWLGIVTGIWMLGGFSVGGLAFADSDDVGIPWVWFDVQNEKYDPIYYTILIVHSLAVLIFFLEYKFRKVVQHEEEDN